MSNHESTVRAGISSELENIYNDLSKKNNKSKAGVYLRNDGQEKIKSYNQINIRNMLDFKRE